MLSRVAQQTYWMARYVERAENTARIINVNTHLLLDMPHKATPGWEPLIEITGSEALFHRIYPEVTERNVVRFLIGDETNPGSILSSIAKARENARTIRDIIPREAWEQLNALHLITKSGLQAGLSQRRRHEYLRDIIMGVQQITGLLAGTMTHDHGYDFLRMGRNLERADMTTRIIDVRSADLLPMESGSLGPFETIQWMSVLKSLTAYQMYRREVQGPVRRRAVLAFLFQSRQFPRALYHCLREAESCLQHLPRNDTPLRTLAHLQRTVNEAQVNKLEQQDLHRFIDDLELGLADLDRQIATTYFDLATTAETPAMAAQPNA